MEPCVKSNSRKKFKKDDDIDETTNIKPKSLLQELIEYIWDESCGQYCSDSEDVGLKNWFKYMKIDFDSESLYFNLNALLQKPNSSVIWARLGYRLKSILHILLKHEDNLKEHHLRQIFMDFLNEYLKKDNLTQKQLLKTKILIKQLKARGLALKASDIGTNILRRVVATYPNIETLKLFLSCISDVKASNQDGNTILHIIVEQCFDEKNQRHKDGYMEIVRSLVSEGVDLNKKNKNQTTAVHLAAEKYHIEMLKFFEERSDGIFKGHTHGEDTYLHFSCKSSLKLTNSSMISKSIETIDFLISRGCDIEAVGEDGYVPLHYAAYSGNVKFVDRLIELGVNVNSQTKRFMLTPLHLAARNEQLDVMMSLIKAGADVNAEASEGATPIFVSALLGTFEGMQYLIDQGAHIHIRDLLGFTLIHAAAMSPINSFSNDGKTINGNKKLDFLIEKGLNVNDTGTSDLTPLHLATITNNVSAVVTLIKKGADVNFQSNSSQLTPLHIATILSHSKIVEMLIKAGADPNRRIGIKQWTPLHIVTTPGSNGSSKYLNYVTTYFSKVSYFLNRHQSKFIAHEPYKGTIILDSAKKDILARILVKNGANLNLKDSLGRTPLYLASTGINRTILNILIEAGAHVNLQDNKGQSLLTNALNSSDVEFILEKLLECGAEINDDDFSQEIVKCKGAKKCYTLSEKSKFRWFTRSPNFRREIQNFQVELKTIVFEQVIKRKCLGLPTAEIYEPYISILMREPFIKDFYDECLKDMNKIKNHYVGNVSLYQFLHMNSKSQCRIVEDISRSYKKIKFSNYGHIIRGACREAIIRKSLIEPARIALLQIFNNYLPDLCVEHILSYLSNRYLEAIIDSVEVDVTIFINDGPQHVMANLLACPFD